MPKSWMHTVHASWTNCGTVYLHICSVACATKCVAGKLWDMLYWRLMSPPWQSSCSFSVHAGIHLTVFSHLVYSPYPAPVGPFRYDGQCVVGVLDVYTSVPPVPPAPAHFPMLAIPPVRLSVVYHHLYLLTCSHVSLRGLPFRFQFRSSFSAFLP